MKFLKSRCSWLFIGVLVCTIILGLGSSAAPNALAQEGGIGTTALKCA